jgi:hypothetical protein
VVALGLPIADPLIGLGITFVILKITWAAIREVSGDRLFVFEEDLETGLGTTKANRNNLAHVVSVAEVWSWNPCLRIMSVGSCERASGLGLDVYGQGRPSRAAYSRWSGSSITRPPRPWVKKLNAQRISTRRRFWKPIRYQRWTTTQVTQAGKPLSRIV